MTPQEALRELEGHAAGLMGVERGDLSTFELNGVGSDLRWIAERFRVLIDQLEEIAELDGSDGWRAAFSKLLALDALADLSDSANSQAPTEQPPTPLVQDKETNA